MRTLSLAKALLCASITASPILRRAFCRSLVTWPKQDIAALYRGFVATHRALLRATTTLAVASTVVLAVPHSRALRANRLADFEQLRLSFYQWLFQLDFAEEVVSRDDFVFIRNLWREWSSGWVPPSDHLDDVIETLQRPGVLTAALTYYRTALGHAPADARVEELRKNTEGDISVPTLLLLGTRDRCLLPRMSRGAESAFAGSYRSESLDAGHFLHLQCPHEVSKAAAEWFKAYPIAAV